MDRLTAVSFCAYICRNFAKDAREDIESGCNPKFSVAQLEEIEKVYIEAEAEMNALWEELNGKRGD